MKAKRKLVRESISEAFKKGGDVRTKMNVGLNKRIRDKLDSIDGLIYDEITGDVISYYAETEEALEKAINELGYDVNFNIDHYMKSFFNTNLIINFREEGDPFIVVALSPDQIVNAVNHEGKEISEEQVYEFIGQ